MLDSRTRKKVEANAKALADLGEEKKVKEFLFSLLKGNCISYKHPDDTNGRLRYDDDIIEFLEPIKHLHPYLVVSRVRNTSYRWNYYLKYPDNYKALSRPSLAILMFEPFIEDDGTFELDKFQQTILLDRPGWGHRCVSAHGIAYILTHFKETELVKRVSGQVDKRSKCRKETSVYRLG